MISVASGLHSAKNKDNKVKQNASLNVIQNVINKGNESQNISKKIHKLSSSQSDINNNFGFNRFYQIYQMGSYHQSRHVQIYDIPSPKLLGNQFRY